MCAQTRQRGRPPKTRSLDLAREPFLQALRDACRLACAAEQLAAQSERERQIEDAFFRAAVALEAFLTDWMARCLAFDTSRLRRYAEGHLRKQAEDHLRGTADAGSVVGRTVQAQSPMVRVELPLRVSVTLATARELLGAADSNRSWVNAAELKEWTGKYIADARGRAIGSLNAEQDALLDATLALRNVLAHRSARAAAHMNEVLRSPSLPSDLRISRNVTPAKIGRYLRANQSGTPRFVTYLTALAQIAYTMAKTRGRRLRICPRI